MGPVEQVVKSYILSEYLNGEDPNELTTNTPLITSGVLDSMATLKLALYLEEQYSIAVGPQDMNTERMDTIGRIAELVRSKSDVRS